MMQFPVFDMADGTKLVGLDGHVFHADIPHGFLRIGVDAKGVGLAPVIGRQGSLDIRDVDIPYPRDSLFFRHGSG